MGRSRFHQSAEQNNRARNQFTPDKTLNAAVKDAKRQAEIDRQLEEAAGLIIAAILAEDDGELLPTAEQMAQNQVRFSRHSLDSDEVIVHRYNPARDVACSIIGIPYGMIGVSCAGSDVRSHEIKLDGYDSSVFLPHLHTQAERSVWETWRKERGKRRGAIPSPYRTPDLPLLSQA